VGQVADAYKTDSIFNFGSCRVGFFLCVCGGAGGIGGSLPSVLNPKTCNAQNYISI